MAVTLVHVRLKDVLHEIYPMIHKNLPLQVHFSLLPSIITLLAGWKLEMLRQQATDSFLTVDQNFLLSIYTE